MPIYYSLIARDTTVLVDHSENTGNFPQIAQTILAKVPREDTKCTYISGRYHLNIQYDIQRTQVLLFNRLEYLRVDISLVSLLFYFKF